MFARMAQGPFNLSIQRIGDALGRLLAPQRAVRFLSPFTSMDVPADTLRGVSGSGEITGYTAIGLDTSQLPGLVTSRIIFGTSPMRINGGDSADLGATNITVTIEPATTLSPGSLSAADKALINTLAVGSVAPISNTVLLRGPSGEGKCTSFEMSEDGFLRANIGGDEVPVATVNGTKDITFGDAVEANSISTLAKTNGNISTLVTGTGTWLTAAVGASSIISMLSNSFEVLRAVAGALTLASADVATGAGKNVVINAGDTGDASAAGSILMTAGTTTGGPRGNIRFTIPIQGGNTGFVAVNDGTNDRLTFSANLGSSFVISNGDLGIQGAAGLSLSGGTGGTATSIQFADAQPIVFFVNGSEVARFDAGGPAAPTTIQPNDAASAGISTKLARDDHRHAIAAAVAGAIAIGDAAAEGASTSFSRADHTHSLAAPATPQSVGAANSAGASTAPARADHVHAHAYQQYMGANTLTGTTTTRYLSVGFNTGTASSNILDMDVRKPFSINALGMLARVGGTAGQTITATIRKNGATVGTAVLTTASDATSGNNTFTAVTFVAGDTWGLQIDKSGAIATSPSDIIYTVGMTP